VAFCWGVCRLARGFGVGECGVGSFLCLVVIYGCWSRLVRGLRGRRLFFVRRAVPFAGSDAGHEPVGGVVSSFCGAGWCWQLGPGCVLGTRGWVGLRSMCVGVRLH